MPTTFRLVVLLFVTSLLLPGQCCQTYIKFGHSKDECAFHVTYNDTVCHNFIWSHCSYDSDDYKIINQASFSACTQRCCDQQVVYAQNWDGIRQCQDYLDWKVYVTLIIIFGIFGGIPITLLILVFIYVVVIEICRACNNCCPQSREGVAPQRNHRQNIDVSSLEMLQPQVVHVQMRWNRRITKNEKLRENCCICLQKGISLELECGHVYHRKCIVAWLRKKQACALCRSNELGTVKIYCEGCFSSFRNTTLLGNLGSLEFNQQLCSNCR